MIFVSVACSFGIYIWKIIAKTSDDEILPYTFFKDDIQSLSVYDSFHVNFCEWYKVGVQFHLSACVDPVSPATFVQATVLFPVNILLLCQMLVDCVCWDFILSSLCCSSLCVCV